jgi:hypothetical protein
MPDLVYVLYFPVDGPSNSAKSPMCSGPGKSGSVDRSSLSNSATTS